jgi:hypothetical protein
MDDSPRLFNKGDNEFSQIFPTLFSALAMLFIPFGTFFFELTKQTKSLPNSELYYKASSSGGRRFMSEKKSRKFVFMDN